MLESAILSEKVAAEEILWNYYCMSTQCCPLFKQSRCKKKWKRLFGHTVIKLPDLLNMVDSTTELLGRPVSLQNKLPSKNKYKNSRFHEVLGPFHLIIVDTVETIHIFLSRKWPRLTTTQLFIYDQ